MLKQTVKGRVAGVREGKEEKDAAAWIMCTLTPLPIVSLHRR